MAGIYKRGRIWWLTYHVGKKTINVSLRTENGREAEKIKAQFEARVTSGLFAKPSSTPIGPFLEALCGYWRKTRASKSAEGDIGRLRAIFGPCCLALAVKKHSPKRFRQENPNKLKLIDPQTGQFLPVKRLEDLAPAAISAWLHDRFMGEDIGGKTANNYRAALSGMYSYAKQYHGYVCPIQGVDNPIRTVERFDEEPTVIIWLTLDQITAQLEALTESPVIRAMVALYIYAGLRRSEALWLTKDDVDLEGKVIRVRAKTVDGRSWKPKTGKNRTVPISQKLLAELEASLPLQNGVWFFSVPQERGKPGRRWDADYFSECLREINKAKGLPWSCVEYRHTFGSHLAQKGISLYKISELMGNSPEICRKHYAALLPQEMHDEVEF